MTTLKRMQNEKKMSMSKILIAGGAVLCALILIVGSVLLFSKSSEESLDFEQIKLMSDTTLKSLSNEDRQQRIDKFNYWKRRLNGNIVLYENDVPFVYPYIANTVQEANNLVEKLKQENIVVYRYWNNLPNSYPEKNFYTNLVAIPLNTLE